MPIPEPSLQGKVAIVTGAGKGIGQAMALAYARHGAAVCCAGRTASALQVTASAISAAGGQAIAVTVDVTQQDAVGQMVQATVQAFGGLDVLIINAGIGGVGRSVEEGDVQAWRQTLDTNLVGAYLCAQAAIPALKQRGGGKIIAIGSGLGHRGLAGLSDYACSKAGLWMLTRILAQELAPFNIDVNELIPGPVATDMTAAQFAQQQLSNPALQQEWVKTPEDVIPLALFLATQPPRGPTAQSFCLMRRDI